MSRYYAENHRGQRLVWVNSYVGFSTGRPCFVTISRSQMAKALVLWRRAMRAANRKPYRVKVRTIV